MNHRSGGRKPRLSECSEYVASDTSNLINVLLCLNVVEDSTVTGSISGGVHYTIILDFVLLGRSNSRLDSLALARGAGLCGIGALALDRRGALEGSFRTVLIVRGV